MENNETIIIQLYNIYKFIEPEFLKFKKLPFLNDVKALKDGLNRINNYISQEIEEKGFINTFKMVVSKSDIYNAFIIFELMSRAIGYEFSDEDVIALVEDKEYQPYYDDYIKQSAKNRANNINEDDMNNELLKRVLEIRLNFLLKEKPKQEIKKDLTSHISKIKKEKNKLVSNKAKSRRNKNEGTSKEKINEYNTSIYEMINVESSLIDEIIAELPEHEQKLIQRRERIGQGYIMKLLTPKEETKIKEIVNKIKFKLVQKGILVEEQSIEKIKLNKGEVHMRKTIYELVKGNKEEVDKIIETLPEADRQIIEKRVRGKLTKEERARLNLIVSKMKTRLGTRRDQLAKAKPTKTIEKKRTKGKTATSIYNLIDNSSGRLYNMIMSELSKEERDIVMKREHYILDKKDEDKLTPDEKNKFNYIVQKLKRKLNNPTKKKTAKKISNKELKQELSIKEKESLNKVGNMSTENVKEKVVETPTKEETNNFSNNYKTLLSIAMKDPKVMQEVDVIDLSITCLRYGIGKSEKPRNISIIAKCYDITPEMVEEISTRVLEKLYNVLVDGIIESNHQQYIKIANKTN